MRCELGGENQREGGIRGETKKRGYPIPEKSDQGRKERGQTASKDKGDGKSYSDEVIWKKRERGRSGTGDDPFRLPSQGDREITEKTVMAGPDAKAGEKKKRSGGGGQKQQHNLVTIELENCSVR